MFGRHSTTNNIYDRYRSSRIFPGAKSRGICNLTLEHILQNYNHILNIDLVIVVDIAVCGVFPIGIARLRLIPALTGCNVKLIDLTVVVDITGCTVAHSYGRRRRFDRAQQRYHLSVFIKAGNRHTGQLNAQFVAIRGWRHRSVLHA